MLRKILYGSLAALLLSILVVGGIVGVTLYEIQNLTAQVKELQERYTETNQLYGRELHPEELARPEAIRSFLEIRRATGDELKLALEAIDEELMKRELDVRNAAEKAPGFLSLMQILRTQFRRLDSVGQFHVRQLIEHQMSSEEYVAHTRALMATLALAHHAGQFPADEQTPTSATLARWSGRWDAYEPPRRLFSDVFGGSMDSTVRLARPVRSLEELFTSATIHPEWMELAGPYAEALSAAPEALMLLAAPQARGEAPREAPSIGLFRKSGRDIDGAMLLDILIKQFDLAVLLDE